jgi:hypothetical protein
MDDCEVAVRVATGRLDSHMAAAAGTGRVGRRIACGWIAVYQPPQARHLANLAIIQPTRPAHAAHAA